MDREEARALNFFGHAVVAVERRAPELLNDLQDALGLDH